MTHEPSADTLIGRTHPVAVLRGELTRAVESHGGLVLVTGEAGIGKTTLATRAAQDGREAGALVLGGACWDSDNAPGHWPWTQVARALRRSATAEEWRAAQDAGGAGLAVLLGETTRAEVTEGFALHDAVTSALVAVSQSRPVAVVLDDLHWADTASLRLLEFVAHHAWFERLLLVGTYRDVEVDSPDHPLAPLLATLATKATTLTLTGLDQDDVAALVARTLGERPSDDAVATIHRRTGGNPFFVEQTARLWAHDGAPAELAPGVREVVRHRLSLLPAPVTELLTNASVLGREFHRQVLAATTAAPVARVDRLLERATSARLVVPRGDGVFGFTHDLVRESLYASLDELALRTRHAAVVAAVDRDPAALERRVFTGDLARHAYLAGDELALGHRVDLQLAAGRAAASRMAVDEAVAHFRRGIELAGDDEPGRHVVLVAELSGELRHNGEADEATRLITDAAAFARERDPALLARVALASYRPDPHGSHPHKVELVREAHAALLGGGADESASVDGLAIELAIALERTAREAGDDEALSFSLWTMHDTIWGPGTAEKRVALVDELAEVARRTNDHETEQYAVSLRWVALLERGDPGYLGQLDAFVRLTEARGDTRMRMGALVDRCLVAAFTGHFTEAEELYERISVEEPPHAHPDAEHMLRLLRWHQLHAQGRLDELTRLDLGAQTVVGHADVLAALVAVEAGDTGPARRYLASSPDPETRFSSRSRALWLRFLAATAAATADPALCERARAALTPLAGLYLVGDFGFDLGGPVTYWLARLDAAQGRWDEASERLREARDSAEAMRARPWVLHTDAALATVLEARGDTDAATELRATVDRQATDMDLRLSPPESVVDAGRRLPANEFRLDRDTWTLTMAGTTIHLPDAKGLRDLHTLLAHPSSDIAAVSLLDPAGGEVVVAAGRLGGDAVLDEQAKAAYQRRLSELDGAIDAAVERGDDDRAASLDTERAALLRELRAAAGLGGRTRRLGDEAERARKAVTARIRETLRKLDDRHPALAAHLRETVSTGARCRYDPPRDGVSWRL